MAVMSDVSRRDHVERLGQEARSFLTSVDYMVASAGIMRPNAFMDISPEEWDHLLAVNLTGCFLCCREVVPTMIRQKSGAIVLVASMAGRSTSVWGGAHYTASKHGVIGLARHLARELGPAGVRVNAFCPGGTLTPLVVNATTEEARQTQAAKRPLGRWASAEEQARVIAFLLSDQSSFMTGVALDSNGGALMV
jgi:3-oxoacyl-[acyl-carrier protein] reductase